MRLRDLCIVGLGLCLALPASAQDDERLKTVVLGIKARRGVEPGLAAAMTDVVHGELSNDPGRSVFSRGDLERVLQFEADKQSVGCDSDSCLAEVAAALDADRIVNGSMDKIGSKFFIVINEIDARNIQPVARVQERVPADEDKLIDAVIKISRQLMIKGAASGVPDGPRQQEAKLETDDGVDVGVAMLRSEPPGLEVFYGGQSIGKTPLRVPGVPVGDAAFEARLEDGTKMSLHVPVQSGQTTEVRADLNVPNVVTTQDIEDYEAASTAHWISTWVSLGASAGTTLLVGGAGLLGVVATYYGLWYLGVPLLCVAGVSGVAGCALLGWGVFKLFSPPDEPTPGGAAVHRVQIKTPDGAVKMREFDAAVPDGDGADTTGDDVDDATTEEDAAGDEGAPGEEGDDATTDGDGPDEAEPAPAANDDAESSISDEPAGDGRLQAMGF